MAQELEVAESNAALPAQASSRGRGGRAPAQPEARAAYDGVIQAWIQRQQERLQEGPPTGSSRSAHAPGARLARQIVLPRSWDWQAPTRPLDGCAALVERAGRRS